MRCIQLACENPADRGEFRVFNQITEFMSLQGIADTIAAASPEVVAIEHIENPRVGLENHHYHVVNSGLVELGLEPHLLSDTLIESLFEITKRYAHWVRPEAMIPTVQWRKTSSTISSWPHRPSGRAGTGLPTARRCAARRPTARHHRRARRRRSSWRPRRW